MRALVISALAVLALAGCQKPQANQAQSNQAEANQAAAAAQGEPVKGVDRSHRGQPAPTATFKDPDGGDISLADFKGTPVLVNLWASWCAPCIKELPTIDRLAQSHDIDGELGVIAVNEEDVPHLSVVAFLEKRVKAKSLGAYQDPDMALSGYIGPDAVLPTTFLFDANGKEVWRYVGEFDWTSPEAAKLIAEAKPGGKG